MNKNKNKNQQEQQKNVIILIIPIKMKTKQIKIKILFRLTFLHYQMSRHVLQHFGVSLRYKDTASDDYSHFSRFLGPVL